MLWHAQGHSIIVNNDSGMSSTHVWLHDAGDMHNLHVNVGGIGFNGWVGEYSLGELAIPAPLPPAPPVAAAPPIAHPAALPEWLHLLAVLPAESVARLLPPSAQRLMAQAPWYWPTGWSLFDVGRRQIWECEPVIPMIPESLLRSWAAVTKMT